MMNGGDSVIVWIEEFVEICNINVFVSCANRLMELEKLTLNVVMLMMLHRIKFALNSEMLMMLH